MAAVTPSPQPKYQRQRFTIGFIGGALDDSLRSQMGFIHAAEAEAINLVIFSGHLLAGPGEPDPPRNRVFDLAAPENVDGLFIDSDHLGHYAGLAKTRVFCQRYAFLPLVNSGPPLPQVPHLDLNHYDGMRQVVSHLIEDHHLTKIAFIRGPEMSGPMTARYRAYRNALRDHNVPFDERLVVPGGFTDSLEHEGVDALILDRGLQPGTDFQAVVGTNDWMAARAIEALRRHGVRVPEDVAVAGFDDAVVALATTPTLTTAYLPRYEMGVRAVRALCALRSDAGCEETISLPVALLCRESCGCRPGPGAPTAAVPPQMTTASPLADLSNHRAKIGAKLAGTAYTLVGTEVASDLDGLFDALITDVSQSNCPEGRRAFLSILSELLGRSSWPPQLGGLWETLIDLSRNEILPYLAGGQPETVAARSRLEGLCQQARALISQTTIHAQWQHQTLTRMANTRLLELNDQMAAVYDIDELMGILVKHLPLLDIPGCFVSVYENPDDPLSYLRLLLAYDRSGRVMVDEAAARFPTRQLLPQGILDPQRRHTLVVYPLCYHQEQWGIIVFELGPNYGLLYETLHGQICSTFKRIHSQQEAEQARRTAEDARRTAEDARRTAEDANSLKSRFLTTVSHELRTPLDVINSLSGTLLREASKTAVPTVYQRELEVIYATSEHLKRLVLDVLDLGRSQLGQLVLETELLGVEELFRDIAPLGRQLAEDKGLAWNIQIDDHLPQISGDRARLRQVIINLLSNACKFTNKGCITLSATAEAGTVTIAVSDTGLGVPVNEQTTIFDEFSQSQRTATRGYGGMGLGLAISRRLVELHGGTIGVNSSGEEDAGATFYVTLPVACVAVIDAPHPVDRNQWRDRVLIVYENREVQSPQPIRLLERGNLKTATLNCEDPNACFQSIKVGLPSAIILECGPSARWGVDLASKIKGDPATRAIPVLFYRSLPHEQAVLFDFDYLPKPVEPDVLARALVQRGLMTDVVNDHRTILVVDDEPTILELHRRRLLQLLPNSRVLVAYNGQQAIEAMRSEPPDLVLLDLLMPEMDGFAVLNVMSTQETLRSIPVIVLTAGALSEDTLERLSQRVDAVLAKGVFTVEETVAQIRAALEHGKHRGSATQKVARHAMVYLHEHFAEPISRDELAQHIGVDARYMTRCFRNEIGLTPTDYLNRYRVWQAKQLLEEGRRSITQVALDVGFNSAAYFSRVFRSQVGMSPREFQQRHPDAVA